MTARTDAEEIHPLAVIVLRDPKMAGRASTRIGGPRLRDLRRASGLTQERLASIAGVSYATISRLESEEATPCRPRTAARLAIALGAHPGALDPEPLQARAATTATSVAALSAAMAGSGVEVTVTATDTGAEVAVPITAPNVATLVGALALALNIISNSRP